MIIVIDALNRGRFGTLLDEMFRLRARVFGDRLGWEVTVKNGMEIDQFDALDPAYLVGLDADGYVVSCARLLQTTGPHMLSDVFSSLLDGEPPLRSPQIWESTRFCVDTTRLKDTGGVSGISRATCEIMIAILEYGRSAGISDIVTVIDPVMDRVLKRSNCAPHGYVGTRKPMGKVAAMAALVDCSEERSEAVRAFSGIEGAVFLSDSQAVETFARNPAAAPASNVLVFPAPKPSALPQTLVNTDDILSYCVSLIQTAEGTDGRRAAFMAVRDLLVHVGMAEQIKLLATALDEQRELVWS